MHERRSIMFFDPLYVLISLPALIFALYATIKTNSAFSRYSRIASSSGLTGAQAAMRLLAIAGVRGVSIEPVSGVLSDHYDPSARKLRLSTSVFGSRSLAAIGVACHEAGHAIQHAESYKWLSLRTALVPMTSFSTWISYIIITAGFVFSSTPFLIVGALLFSLAVVFSFITLPVEYDATKRAKALMLSAGIVGRDQLAAAGRVLDAAFLTYVAAAVSSLLTFLYYIVRIWARTR